MAEKVYPTRVKNSNYAVKAKDVPLPTFDEPTSLKEAKLRALELGNNLSGHVYILGRILIWVKKKVGHGNFEDWIDKNVWFTIRTAQNFIKFAHKCRRHGKLLLYFPSKTQSLRLLGFEPKIYDIWNFQGIDDRFGQEHPGNIPAGIILNTLYYYTDIDGKVVDPMAGGGVTIDCCKYLKRRCLAYDVEPKRKDIKQNNITQGYPSEAQSCDLIFLDPPYYKKKKEDYGEKSISALPTDQYWRAFEEIAKHSYQCIKEKGFLALLMEPYIDYQNSTNSLWLYQYINIFLDNKWLVERIFDVPESSQRYAAHDVTRAKKQNQILTLRRQLVIFRK